MPKTAKPDHGAGYDDPDGDKRARAPWQGHHPGVKPCKIKLKARNRRRRALARKSKQRNR